MPHWRAAVPNRRCRPPSTSPPPARWAGSVASRPAASCQSGKCSPRPWGCAEVGARCAAILPHGPTTVLARASARGGQLRLASQDADPPIDVLEARHVAALGRQHLAHSASRAAGVPNLLVHPVDLQAVGGLTAQLIDLLMANPQVVLAAAVR